MDLSTVFSIVGEYQVICDGRFFGRYLVTSLEISGSASRTASCRSVTSRVADLRKGAFICAHDKLGHLGLQSPYAVLREVCY